MSSDAKIWQEVDEGWFSWKGTHDGVCNLLHGHESGEILATLLNNIETCMGPRNLRWVFHLYPDGKIGLMGYLT